MKYVLCCLAVCICLLTSHSVTTAQQVEANKILAPYWEYSLGVYGSFNFNQHSAGMRGLPTIPSCCPEYGNGTGTGLMLGAMLDLYLAEKFSLYSRVGIHSGGGLLRALETETVNTDGVAQKGVFEHTITSKHTWLIAEPLLSFAAIDRLNVMVGPTVGLLLSASFAQKEEILEPSDAMFNNDSTTRAIYSGDIPQTNTLSFGITGGVRYEIPISGNMWSVAPELFYTLGLTNLQQSQAWKMNAVRLGITIQYNRWIQPLP